jgi:Endoplasmic Reticulum-Golgi Intermediate Compartment (ERGIC)
LISSAINLGLGEKNKKNKNKETETMNNLGFLNKLKNLDAYPKINEDFYKRTLSGGIITAVSGLVILLLFFSETSEYFLSFFSLQFLD